MRAIIKAWLTRLFGGASPPWPREKKKRGLPILTYHHHLPEALKETSLYRNGTVTNTVESFAEQMAWLHENGYSSVKLAEFEEYMKGEQMDIERKVMITFDDGHLSVARYCYGILKRYGFTAVVFLITGYQPELPVAELDPDRLQYVSRMEMFNQTDVYEWAAHTHRMHKRDEQKVSRLVAADHATLLEDAIKCRQMLDGTEHFCFPFGQYSPQAIDTLVEAGYRYFYSTERGLAYPDPDHDVHVVRRLNVSPWLKLDQFAQLVRESR
ncbi:polysaccharide deacetylase family protein [Bordetella sp. N]|uniref:polysaccharide deacetylase family protein n=1 Tax=Bordetella sp. N TaxID=1746199 RepID=UPI00070CBE67|nr:polysaccharide deacetylase family protein [Bordetella sp. N]ALM86450.1 hypothetical protein ASB57_29085 [Bordetella sp. N]